MSYAGFKAAYPIGTAIVTVQGVKNPFGVQCVNVARAYAAYLFPDVPFADSITSGDARTLFANASPKYFQKIPYAPGLQPQPGDIAVFDATPKAGYTNQFDNPDGHVGLIESANATGYYLLQENAPNEGQGVNITYYPWNFRPCIGFLRPLINEGDSMTRGVMAAMKFLAVRQNECTDAEFAKYGNDVEAFVQYLTAVQSEHSIAPQPYPPTTNREAALDYVTKNLK